MCCLFSALVVLGRGGYPWVAAIIMLLIVSYQLMSGKLVGLRWETWVTRKDHPRKYWTLLTVEAVVVLAFLFVGILTL